MNTSAQAKHWYQQVMAESAPQPLESQLPWWQQVRRQARESFARVEFPTRKHEAWRYTPLDKLLQQSFVPATRDPSLTLGQSRPDLAIPGLDAYRMVFVNGHFDADASQLAGLPAGVTLTSIATLLHEQPQKLAALYQQLDTASDNAFSALHTALSTDGLFIHVDENVHVDKPVEVVFVAAPGEQAVTSVPGIIVSLAAGARATWIERYTSTGQSFYFQNVLARIALGPGAKLDHYRVVAEHADAYHLSTIHVRQQAASDYRAMTMHLNGTWLRSDWQVDLLGTDALSSLTGLCLVNGSQLSDVHTRINHSVPACKSYENFKSLLLGNGRMVFDGSIKVQPQAQQTEAVMRNDNLMLSDDAEVDTKPQLEIFADNVKCSHGTTVGQLDAEQLFYLRSRGIDRHTAKQMLCQGFLGEITAACALPELRAYAEHAIADALAAASGA